MVSCWTRVGTYSRFALQTLEGIEEACQSTLLLAVVLLAHGTWQIPFCHAYHVPFVERLLPPREQSCVEKSCALSRCHYQQRHQPVVLKVVSEPGWRCLRLTVRKNLKAPAHPATFHAQGWLRGISSHMMYTNPCYAHVDATG